MNKPKLKYQWMYRNTTGTHCSKCNSHTTGSGTEDNPFRCKCGIWLYDKVTKQFSLVK